MGCAQSRIDNEESVSRCKERKNLMKDAVVARNAFAAGHSGYVVSLKNTGAALSDYGHGESEATPEVNHQPLDNASQPPPPPPPIDSLLPPPPPLPSFSPSSSPIKRATSLPAMPLKQRKTGREIDSDAIAEEDEEVVDEGGEGKGLRNGVGEVRPAAAQRSPPRTPDMKSVPPMPESKGMAWDYFFTVDNVPEPSLSGVDENEPQDDDGEAMDMGFGENDNVGGRHGDLGNGIEEVEFKTPEKAEEGNEEEMKSSKQIEHSKTAPPEFRRVVKADSGGGVTLMQILRALDDHFLKASESAQDVSKMLEATRLHYHSNFADNRGDYYLPNRTPG